MKKRITLISLVTIVFVGCMSMEPTFDPKIEKDSVRKVIHSSIGWALTKDKDLLLRSVAQDTTFFIYHPDNASTIRGFEPFRSLVENVFMNDAFKALSYEIHDLQINFSQSHDVAWFSAILDDFGEWDGRPLQIPWEGVRWTGVLEKRQESWVIVQMHFSFATDARKEKGNENDG